MNVLLLRPEHPYVHALSFDEKTYPIGIGFLIAVLRQNGHKVTFVDRYISPNEPIDLDLLTRKRIDLVGIYMCSITYRSAVRLLERLQLLRRSGQWQGLLAVGGPHASLKPESVPDYVDYVVIGEGEQAVVDIADGNCYQRVVRYPRIPNLDALPFPAYDVLVKMPYDVKFAMMNYYPLVNTVTSRGCPFNCRFCSVNAIWGREYSAFSAERVVADVKRLNREYGFQAVYFREDNFLLDHRRVRKICDLFTSQNVKVKWGCEARVSDLQDEDFVRQLSIAGCVHVFLGVESLSGRVLRLMNKKITVEQIELSVTLCRKYNITPFGSFIIGVPGETEEEMWTTINGARAMFRDTTYCLNTYMGIPSSEMYNDAIRNGNVDYLDETSGFFYIRNHDNFMQLSLNGEVPVTRRSPTRYITRPDNTNNKTFELTAWRERFKGKRLLELRNSAAVGKATEAVAYQGLLSISLQLDDTGKYDAALLNNMLHSVHPDDLPYLLGQIREHLTISGTVIGVTPSRGNLEVGEAIMNNYYAEYVYSLAELQRALVRAGFEFNALSESEDPVIYFEAQVARK